MAACSISVLNGNGGIIVPPQLRVGFPILLDDLDRAAGHDLHGQDATAQEGHPKERVAVSLVDRHAARPAMPEDEGFVRAKRSGATIGQLHIHETALSQGQGAHHAGRKGEVTGEAGVDHGRHLDTVAVRPAAEDPDADHGLPPIRNDPPAHRG
jgi:hypothetical protein